MTKFLKKYFWTILVIIAAIGLAGSAAYFSISGLSKLFAGSALQIIIMASFLEFAKIATTAALHRFWKSISWTLKIPLTLMVVIIMAITSSGIYGFLADAYSTTSVQLQKIEGQIALIEKQKEQKNQKIIGIEEIKISKTGRMNTLNNLRVQQEARIDSLYSKRMYSSVKKAQEIIDNSTKEIQTLQVDIDTLLSRIQVINGEIGELDIQILDLQNTDVATELGPLKYMSSVTKQPMENIINWFIMAIMIAFDPLAVLLVILANVIYDRANKNVGGNNPPEKKDYKEPEPQEKEIEQEEKVDYQRVIDAVNNTNPEILDYSYDFVPENKKEEIVEYVEGKDGSFEKSTGDRESLATLIKNIDSNPIYLQLIEVLFKDGERNVEDTIPSYKVVVKDVERRGIVCDEKIIKNFITICNLLDIINMNDKDNVKIIKDYASSKQIISLISK